MIPIYKQVFVILTPVRVLQLQFDEKILPESTLKVKVSITA